MCLKVGERKGENGASTYNGIAVLMCYDVLFRAGEILLSLNLTGH